MDSDKRKVKQIAGLIVFTMLVYTIFINYEKVFAGIEFLWDLIFPFVLGAAIAFLLNLPMRGIEKLLKKQWASLKSFIAKHLNRLAKTRHRYLKYTK